MLYFLCSTTWLQLGGRNIFFLHLLRPHLLILRVRRLVKNQTSQAVLCMCRAWAMLQSRSRPCKFRPGPKGGDSHARPVLLTVWGAGATRVTCCCVSGTCNVLKSHSQPVLLTHCKQLQCPECTPHTQQTTTSPSKYSLHTESNYNPSMCSSHTASNYNTEHALLPHCKQYVGLVLVYTHHMGRKDPSDQ